MKRIWIVQITKQHGISRDVSNHCLTLFKTSREEAIGEAMEVLEQSRPSREGWMVVGNIAANALSDETVLLAAEEVKKFAGVAERRELERPPEHARPVPPAGH